MKSDSRLSPTVFVLFGATGDLAKRMVLPAFYQMAIDGLLPREWRLVGNGRGDVAHEDFRGHVRQVLEEFGPKPEDGPWSEFESRLLFAGGGFADDDPGSLLDVLHHAKSEMGEAQYLHYLAVPPSAFEGITSALDSHDLAKGARVIYEKPYGTSPEGFHQLDDLVHSVFDENQVFRIDHFLGKEATQNIHVLRFANGIFESVWNRDHIEAVQIDIPETLDIDDRAEFYDNTGATLDMIVTHLFQVAAEVAMEPPVSLKAEDLQSARESVIAAFRPLRPADVVLGQYEGYRDVDGVAPDSTTDTFAAVRLWVDTERWRDVPFLLRTGKRMAEDHENVSLVFRRPETPLHHLPEQANVLTLSMKGAGSVMLSMILKEPGADDDLSSAEVTLPMTRVPGGAPLAPYVRLVHDVMNGDHSLFTRSDGLGYAWAAVTQLLEDRPDVQGYEPGSWGPQAADELAAPHGWLLR